MLIYDSIKKSHLIIFGCKDAMPGVSGMMEGYGAERLPRAEKAGKAAGSGGSSKICWGKLGS